MRARVLATALAIAALELAGAACQRTTTTPEVADALASPQASAVPAPFANTPTATTTSTVALFEAGPPPVPIRGDDPLPADALPREVVGYTLSAVLRAHEVHAPPRTPDVNVQAIEAARRKMEPRFAIDLSPTRMRVVLAGPGFPLPADTELRARTDRFGHVVVWPGGGSYRPVGPGTLRALLSERRFDVAPLSTPDVVAKDEAGKRIGIRTRRVEIVTRAAKGLMDVGRLPDLGEGGVLLCRMLLDMMNGAPGAPTCGADELPLRAEISWTGQGGVHFEVTGVLRRPDMATGPLATPPGGATYTRAPMPIGGVTPMLAAVDLATLRQGAPGEEGLVLSNPTRELRMFLLDGIPVALVAPNATDTLRGLPPGKYVAQWRTFLGEEIELPVTQQVPGISTAGTVDAGSR